jgi:hypothetical protein
LEYEIIFNHKSKSTLTSSANVGVRLVVAAGRFEEQIVVALGIERRVEIDEVNGFVRKMLAEDLEIVAVIELVHLPLGLAVSDLRRERNFPTNTNGIPKIVPNYHVQILVP